MQSKICFEITLTLADIDDMDIPGNSAGDLFGMVKTWPSTREKKGHFKSPGTVATPFTVHNGSAWGMFLGDFGSNIFWASRLFVDKSLPGLPKLKEGMIWRLTSRLYEARHGRRQLQLAIVCSWKSDKNGCVSLTKASSWNCLFFDGKSNLLRLTTLKKKHQNWESNRRVCPHG